MIAALCIALIAMVVLALLLMVALRRTTTLLEVAQAELEPLRRACNLHRERAAAARAEAVRLQREVCDLRAGAVEPLLVREANKRPVAGDVYELEPIPHTVDRLGPDSQRRYGTSRW